MARGIYAIVCREADKIYVGSALDYAKRISQHLTDLRRHCHSNIHLQRLWNKYGENGLHFVELEVVPFSSDLLKREQAWIDSMRATVPDRLVNFCMKAGSRLGAKCNPRTPEQLQRMADGRRGYRHSEEAKDRIATSNTGQKRSEEAKAKMREAALARWQRREEREHLTKMAARSMEGRQRDSAGRVL